MSTDITTFPDLDFHLVSGRRALAEALARRLQTPRGSLFYAPDYGLDLREMLNMRVTQGDLFAWKAAVEQEIRRDERVLSVNADLTFDMETEAFKAELLVETDEEGTIGFGLSFGSSAAVVATPAVEGPMGILNFFPINFTLA